MSLSEFFKVQGRARNLAICAYLWFATVTVYLMSIKYEHQFPIDPYDNILIHSSVELVGYLVASYTFVKL